MEKRKKRQKDKDEDGLSFIGDDLLLFLNAIDQKRKAKAE